MKLEYSIVIFILIVLMFLLLSSSTMNFVPYYRDSRYLNTYPYEGFSSMNNDSIKYSSNSLKSGKYENESIIDIFSQDEGSPSCIGDSNGLYNSKGGLCLTNDQKYLLQTRGGNASGSPDKLNV